MPKEDGYKNLKPARPGETHNPNGRPKKLSNALKSIPDDAQEKVFGILHYALKLPSVKEATKYIQDQAATNMEYGVVLQIAVKALMSKNGFLALNDILDRLFGKPRIAAEVTHKGGIAVNITTDEETKQIIEEGLG